MLEDYMLVILWKFKTTPINYNDLQFFALCAVTDINATVF